MGVKKKVQGKARRTARRKAAPKLSKKRVKRISRTIKIMPKVVGKVTHYFPHVKAGVILVTSGRIVLGDRLHFKGHTTDFKQKVTSMQINNIPIEQARPKQEVGLLVKSRVRHNDTVYKL